MTTKQILIHGGLFVVSFFTTTVAGVASTVATVAGVATVLEGT